MKVIVVIPTYNERDNIEELVARLVRVGVPDLGILFVDDASPDGTATAVRGLIARFPFLHIIERTGKHGLGSAYVEGFRNALKEGAEIVCEMDADLSHAPEDLPRLIAAITEGADVAIGSRRILGGKIVGWNWRRHFASRGAVWFSRMLLQLHTKDATSGFRAYRAHVLRNINFESVHSDGYAFQEEMLMRCERAGFIIREIPTTFVDRTRGSSKLGYHEIVDFFRSIFRLWMHR